MADVFIFITTMVSIATFFVVYSQCQIASTKIKLDLYNKRFGIYVSVLELHQSFYQNAPEICDMKYDAFIKSFRESKFLFDSSDGIYDILEKMKNDGHIVVKTENISDGNNEPHLPFDKRASAITNFGIDLSILENKMEKYIQFTHIEGWQSIFGSTKEIIKSKCARFTRAP